MTNCKNLTGSQEIGNAVLLPHIDAAAYFSADDTASKSPNS